MKRAKDALSPRMTVRIIKHEAVPNCGSFDKSGWDSPHQEANGHGRSQIEERLRTGSAALHTLPRHR